MVKKVSSVAEKTFEEVENIMTVAEKEMEQKVFRLSEMYKAVTVEKQILKDFIGQELVITGIKEIPGRKKEAIWLQTDKGEVFVTSERTIAKVRYMVEKKYMPFVAGVVAKGKGADLA